MQLLLKIYENLQEISAIKSCPKYFENCLVHDFPIFPDFTQLFVWNFCVIAYSFFKKCVSSKTLAGIGNIALILLNRHLSKFQKLHPQIIAAALSSQQRSFST